jgi:hypothetical protein
MNFKNPQVTLFTLFGEVFEITIFTLKKKRTFLKLDAKLLPC